MQNIYDAVLEILKNDKRFFSKEGVFLRNAAYEAAMKMDADLIKKLYKNKQTKDHFFVDVDGVAVFDKIGFGWVISNKEFLPDSYTRYKNIIGLVNNANNFISSSNDVVLDFPYKDCVLEGGQTKEDQKRKEIFYNETLVPEEVDRLLAPKVLSNAIEIFANQETKVSTIKNKNLMIKGNNLLAIASLLPEFAGRFLPGKTGCWLILSYTHVLQKYFIFILLYSNLKFNELFVNGSQFLHLSTDLTNSLSFFVRLSHILLCVPPGRRRPPSRRPPPSALPPSSR